MHDLYLHTYLLRAFSLDHFLSSALFGRIFQVRWVGDGVRKGVVGLGGNVLSGLNATRHLAYTGLKKDGTSGLVSGMISDMHGIHRN